MIYEKCRDILLRECELIQNAAGVQEKIRQAVTGRELTEFEEHLSTMNAIESKLIQLEHEREKLFTVFETLVHQKTFSQTLDSKKRFYTLVCVLPENQRNELTSIYRSLKIESLKLRMANENLMNYLNGVKETLRDFFSMAFPDRYGKMYTNQGTQVTHDMRSIVLNSSF